MTVMDTHPTEALSVLLVEDNRIDQRALEKLLGQYEQFRSVHAPDIGGAIGQLGEHPFDCILLDWHLPDGDGSQLLEHISRVYPWLPVIVLTGDEEVSPIALSSGAQGFMVKDRFDAGVLERSIVDAIEQKKNANTLELAIHNDRIRSKNRRVRNRLLQDLSTLEVASAAIKAQLEKQQRATPQDPELETIYSFVQESEDTLTRAISSLGELSSYTDLLPNPEPLSPISLYLDALGAIGDKKFEETTLVFRIDPASSNAHIGGERQLLGDVFEHLLRNALDAVTHSPEPKSHRICLTSYTAGELFHAQVSDTGPGIPRVLSEKVFSPFFSLWPETRNGMGLTVSREIVERHGGTLQLLDERPNMGARFQVRLPVTPSDLEATIVEALEHDSLIIMEPGTRLFKRALQLPGLVQLVRCPDVASLLDYLRENPDGARILCDFEGRANELDELLSALEFFDVDQTTKLLVVENAAFGHESRAYLEAVGGTLLDRDTIEETLSTVLGKT